MKFGFIHAEKAHFPISSLCRLLKVTRQEYYAFAKRPVSARVAQERALQEQLRRLHAESREDARYDPTRLVDEGGGEALDVELRVTFVTRLLLRGDKRFL